MVLSLCTRQHAAEVLSTKDSLCVAMRGEDCMNMDDTVASR